MEIFFVDRPLDGFGAVEVGLDDFPTSSKVA